MSDEKETMCQVAVKPPTKYSNPDSKKCKRFANGKLKDGTPACEVHVAAERRRLANADKENKRARDERAFQREVDAVLQPLGISGNITGVESRRVVVNWDELARVIGGIITVEDEYFRYFDLFCHQCAHPDNDAATMHMCDTCRARVLTPTNFVKNKLSPKGRIE